MLKPKQKKSETQGDSIEETVLESTKLLFFVLFLLAFIFINL